MVVLRKFCIAIVLTAVCSFFIPSLGVAYDINKNVEVSDPIEPVNRAIYRFNRGVDKIILKPVAKSYRFVVPELGRRGVRNFLTNMTEPVTFINSIFQRDVKHTFTTFWRFVINTTIGIGGLFDVAEDAGLSHRAEDFGQTAGTFGSGTGPYIMIPILGPSNSRDIFGMVVDTFTDPFNFVLTDYAIAGRTIVSGIDKREEVIEIIEEIDRVSLDPYAATRSLYTQRRADLIINGKK